MATYEVNGVQTSLVTELNGSSYDAVILVTSPTVVPVQALEDFIVSAVQLDRALEKETAVLHCPRVSGNRLVIAPTGPITPYDDVRSIGEAAKRGVERAIAAGSRHPVLVVQPSPLCAQADLVLLFGAFEALYVFYMTSLKHPVNIYLGQVVLPNFQPIQIRELFPEKKAKLSTLGIYPEGMTPGRAEGLLKTAAALEASRVIARDIGGGDPERMTPARVADYVKDSFTNTSVKVRVLDDLKTIEREYPLYAAVNRCANGVDRHRGRIIFLEYNPGGHEETVMLVGKGVTYDTGGCDIKAGGVMAGMSRDKCGAAAVAGFFKACELLKPKLKVVGVMGMVRNSVGADAYVADELVVSRHGPTVRVGNTDAEGRMVMGDLLAEMHDKALRESNPHLYTIATLTGHAHRAVGEGYTIVMDNHAARSKNHANLFRQAGEALGDMVEISTIRREDLKIHRGQGAGDDVHQALNQPSTAVPRGHQGPAGFLLLVSGLHGGSVPYSHLDIAASGGSLPEQPTAAPVLALANKYKLVNY